MTSKYGVFSEPTYIGIGDHYLKKEEKKDEEQPDLNLKATRRKTGKGNDATFDRFKPLFEGERFVDPQRQKLAQLSEKSKKNISDQSWKQASPMKKSTGPGDFYGSLQGKVLHVSESPAAKMKKGDCTTAPPNIYTSPGKKGTFGFNRTTLSERQGAKGVAGEYQYQPDPFDLGIKSVREYEKKKREQRISDSPFRPTNPAKRGGFGVPGLTLAGKGHGISGEYAYKPLGPEQKVAAKVPEVAFRPSHPPHEGYNATLNKFPAHTPDPEIPRIQAEREAKKQQREKLAGQNPWKPSMTHRTDCTRSVVQMNI